MDPQDYDRCGYTVHDRRLMPTIEAAIAMSRMVLVHKGNEIEVGGLRQDVEMFKVFMTNLVALTLPNA